MELVFGFKQISLKKAYISNDLCDSMLNVMETSVNNSEFVGGKKLVYQILSSDTDKVIVSVSPLDDNSDILIIEKENLLEMKSSRIEFLIAVPNLSVRFSLNDLDELAEFKTLNIESVWESVTETYTNEGTRNRYKGFGEIKYGQAELNQIDAVQGRKEYISITFIGIGLGYYRDRFVPDIGSILSFALKDKFGDDHMEFGFQYTHQFFCEEANEMRENFSLQTNGFLTGFYKYHVTKDTEFGAGIGGLVHRQGNFYRGDTFKFVIYATDNSSRISFSPELIFTNNFKSFFPAIRVGLTF
jgi:hypothetical protein